MQIIVEYKTREVNKMVERLDDSRFFDANRLKDLGDGIYAFAMTFLIVTFNVPKVPLSSLGLVLAGRAMDLITYVISFFLLAIFWMTNHIQLKDVKRADSRLVWISMLLFLLIVFVPLTTDIYAFYDGSKLAMLLLNLNILLIALIFMLQWHHLVANKLHHDEFTREEVRDRYNISAALIAVSLLAIAVGYWNPVWSASVYLSLFIYRMYARIRWLRRRAA